MEEIRPAAEAGNPAARDRLTGILADGGVCDDLRRRADAGDSVAAEKLVERLADRGCLRELRDRAHGHMFAAEALADLLAARGDVDQLQTRANAGDQAAELRLSKVHAAEIHPDGSESEIANLRADADPGNPEAAQRLCTRLFELRDADGLSAEMEAGTYGAADRLVALYTAEENAPPERLAQLRAFGLNADGRPFTSDPGK